MLRSQAARIAQTTPKPTATSIASRRSRTYATVPPPPSGQPAPQPKDFEKKGGDKTLLYVGLGLAGAAGAYYYLKETDEPAALEKQARRDQERVKVNARQTLDATKDTANDALALGRAKADQVKDNARDAMYAGKSKVGEVKDDAKREWDTTKGAFRNARGEGGIEEGRGLFDKAEDNILRTKEQTEAAFRNTRDAAEQKAAELRDEASRKASELRGGTARKASEVREGAERKGEEVKEGWFSWLGYGKSKVADAEQLAKERRDQLEAEADRLKREAARGVANRAEDVRVRAEKHT